MRPKRDPWQQKLVTKLKEKKSVDELLKMHSRFLQVTAALNPYIYIQNYNHLLLIIIIILLRKNPAVALLFVLLQQNICMVKM